MTATVKAEARGSWSIRLDPEDQEDEDLLAAREEVLHRQRGDGRPARARPSDGGPWTKVFIDDSGEQRRR